MPDRSLGRVMASLRVVGWAAMLGGTVVGGILGETIGPRFTMLVAAAGGLSAAVWLVASPVRWLWALPAVPSPWI